MDEKSYSEEEISAILGHAARLQFTEGSLDLEGLTLEEIKEAAAAAGIEPAFVEIAASATSNQKKTYLSIPTGASRSMFVKGTLSEESWGKMTGEFVRAFGGPGKTSQESNQRIWSHEHIRITVEELGDQVALHAEANWGKELELPIPFMIVGTVATLMVGALSIVSLEWTIGVVALLLSALLVGSFSWYKRRRADKQERVLDTFESTLNRCAIRIRGEQDAESVGDVEGMVKIPSRIDLEEYAADEESQTPVASRQKRVR